MKKTVLALDTLVGETDVEEECAATEGWQLRRWEGSASELVTADAVVHVTTTVGPALIAQLERCRVVGRFGTGLDTVDLEATARAGIVAVGVRNYCTPELTAHTVALALSLLRVKGEAEPDAIGAQPDWSSFRKRHAIRGDLTAHVVGYGTIGTSVAAVLRALQIETLVTTRHCEAAAEHAGYKVVPLIGGLQRSDLVLFHLDLSAATRSIFGPEALGLVKRGAVVVNTARLALTEEQTLVNGLCAGVLGGVGLDARLAPASPLWNVVGREDLIVTPHVGWYSEASLARLRRSGVTNTIAAYNRVITEQTASFPDGGGSEVTSPNICLVTGAYGGIGKATADLLRNEDWTVIGVEPHARPGQRRGPVRCHLPRRRAEDRKRGGGALPPPRCARERGWCRAPRSLRGSQRRSVARRFRGQCHGHRAYVPRSTGPAFGIAVPAPQYRQLHFTGGQDRRPFDRGALLGGKGSGAVPDDDAGRRARAPRYKSERGSARHHRHSLPRPGAWHTR